MTCANVQVYLQVFSVLALYGCGAKVQVYLLVPWALALLEQ